MSEAMAKKHYYVRLNKGALRTQKLEDSEGNPAFGHPDLGAFRDIHTVEAFGREFIGGGGETLTEEEKKSLEGQGKGADNGKLSDGTPLLEVIGEVGEEDELSALISAGELG